MRAAAGETQVGAFPRLTGQHKAQADGEALVVLQQSLERGLGALQRFADCVHGLHPASVERAAQDEAEEMGLKKRKRRKRERQR